MAAPPYVLALRELSAGWGSRTALRELDLELRSGEILCVVGPGASGKSTLLELIAQQVRRAREPEARARPWSRGTIDVRVDRCTHLAQRDADPRDPSPIELGQLLREPAWLPPAGLPGLELGVERPAELPTSSLKYLRLVSALRDAEAPLRLLDEPLSGLPRPWAERAATLLRERTEPRTSILVTHYLPLVQAVADRVLLLIDGELIEAGPTEAFFSRPKRQRTAQFLKWGT